MTANQIAYQQMLADTRKKEAETEALRLSNEMQALENRQRKFFDYDIQESGYYPSHSEMNENLFGRGSAMASELIQRVLPFKLNFTFK